MLNVRVLKHFITVGYKGAAVISTMTGSLWQRPVVAAWLLPSSIRAPAFLLACFRRTRHFSSCSLLSVTDFCRHIFSNLPDYNDSPMFSLSHGIFFERALFDFRTDDMVFVSFRSLRIFSILPPLNVFRSFFVSLFLMLCFPEERRTSPSRCFYWI